MGKFQTWVNSQGGERVLAKKLGLNWPAVYAWTHGIARPKITEAYKLLKISRGKITLLDLTRLGPKQPRKRTRK